MMRRAEIETPCLRVGLLVRINEMMKVCSWFSTVRYLTVWHNVEVLVSQYKTGFEYSEERGLRKNDKDSTFWAWRRPPRRRAAAAFRIGVKFPGKTSTVSLSCLSNS